MKITEENFLEIKLTNAFQKQADHEPDLYIGKSICDGCWQNGELMFAETVDGEDKCGECDFFDKTKS